MFLATLVDYLDLILNSNSVLNFGLNSNFSSNLNLNFGCFIDLN